jgi:hypothetical protein
MRAGPLEPKVVLVQVPEYEPSSATASATVWGSVEGLSAGVGLGLAVGVGVGLVEAEGVTGEPPPRHATSAASRTNAAAVLFMTGRIVREPARMAESAGNQHRRGIFGADLALGTRTRDAQDYMVLLVAIASGLSSLPLDPGRRAELARAAVRMIEGAPG